MMQINARDVSNVNAIYSVYDVDDVDDVHAVHDVDALQDVYYEYTPVDNQLNDVQ